MKSGINLHWTEDVLGGKKLKYSTLKTESLLSKWVVVLHMHQAWTSIGEDQLPDSKWRTSQELQQWAGLRVYYFSWRFNLRGSNPVA